MMIYYIYNPKEDGFLMENESFKSPTAGHESLNISKYVWRSLNVISPSPQVTFAAYVLTDEILYDKERLMSVMITLRGIGLNDKELKHLHIVPNQTDMGGWWPEFYEAFEFGEHYTGIYYR